MIQPKGWEDLAFHQTEVTEDVGAFGLVNNGRMTHRVGTVFVGPGVERGEIEVMDLFSVVDSMVRFDGIGASTVERLSGFESGDQVEGLDQAPQVLVLFLKLFPFALPHDYYTVACSQ